MVVVSVLLSLRLFGVQNRKDKRAIVRSVVARLRTRLQLSAAEVGMQELLQAAQIGFAVVSGELNLARRVADEARRFVDDELIGRAEVVATEVEEMTIG